MQWLAGTSGYSYKAWRGGFYPPDIAANRMLAHYASQLPAVEINNTFYRMPRSQVLATWRDQVPASFRFAIKASRRITHQAKLANCEDEIAYLAECLQALGDKLGCVLFQLPPYLHKDAGRLRTFLEAWPKAYPAAVEFRHESWFDAEIADLLAGHDAAICVSEDGKLALPRFSGTTDWLYFRLRRPGYDGAALAQWLDKGGATGASRGFAFFKHEDEGTGPKLAARFLDLAQPRPAHGSPTEQRRGGADEALG